MQTKGRHKMCTDKKVSVLLVGVGGFGGQYIDLILKHSDRVRLVGGVETGNVPQETIDKLKDHKTRFYKTMEEFYAENSADLCIVSTPIHLHKEHAICALSHGSNVLCEKPAAACSKDLEEMMSFQNDKFVAVGFQHCFADNILNLKKDIIDGVWGKPKLFKTITFFPRPSKYFKSRKWSGKIMSDDGRMISDSIVNNACAHTLQVLLFLLGAEMNTSVSPESTEVRLYNANGLETFDSIALKLQTTANVPIFYYASHTTMEKHGREFELVLENGSVRYSEDECILKGTFNNGEVKDYGWCKSNEDKFLKCVKAAAGEKDMVSCTLSTAFSQVKAVEMIMQHLDETYIFSADEVKTYSKNSDTYVYVPKMAELLMEAYRENKLPDKENVF